MTAAHDARLRELEALLDGWFDGVGYAMTHGALHGAYALLETGRIFPTPDGGVQIEWTSLGREQSICFAPDGSISLMDVKV